MKRNRQLYQLFNKWRKYAQYENDLPIIDELRIHQIQTKRIRKIFNAIKIHKELVQQQKLRKHWIMLNYKSHNLGGLNLNENQTLQILNKNTENKEDLSSKMNENSNNEFNLNTKFWCTFSLK